MSSVATPSIDAGDAMAAARLPAGARRVSADDMKRRIVGEAYYPSKLNSVATCCELLLDNGFVLFGQSAPADPAAFDREKGKIFAKEDALKKLWPVLGFLLCEDIANETSRTPPKKTSEPVLDAEFEEAGAKVAERPSRRRGR